MRILLRTMSQETVSHSKERQRRKQRSQDIYEVFAGGKKMQSNVKKSLLFTKNRHLNVVNVFLCVGGYKTQFMKSIP